MPSYYSKLYRFDHLLFAWKKISKTNKYSRGFDEVSIEDFSRKLGSYLQQIREELKSRTFRFTPARGVTVPKADGSKRPIKVPAVRDRVVLKAVDLLISPKFQKYNLPCSFGYVRGRSVPDAIAQVRRLAGSGHVWVLEGDISSFFDTVDRKILIRRFVREIRVRSLAPLVENALTVEVGNLECFTPEDKELFPAAESGIPQGGILSPLLANFYLYPFDKAMTEAGFNLVRYADDFVVMCDSETSAKAAFDLAQKLLEDKLKLKLHALGDKSSKTRITYFSKGFTFLGIRFEGSRIYPAHKAIKKFKEKIGKITDTRQGLNLLQALTKLRNTIVGWGQAYRMCDVDKTYADLDSVVKESLSLYLRTHGFLSRGHVLGTRQRKIMGLPSLNDSRRRR